MYESSERRDVDDRSDRRDGRSGISPALIGLVVVAIVAVVFVVENTEDVRVDVLFWDFTAKLWVVIAVSIGIGIVLDRLFGIWWRRRRN